MGAAALLNTALAVATGAGGAAALCGLGIEGADASATDSSIFGAALASSTHTLFLLLHLGLAADAAPDGGIKALLDLHAAVLEAAAMLRRAGQGYHDAKALTAAPSPTTLMALHARVGGVGTLAALAHELGRALSEEGACAGAGLAGASLLLLSARNVGLVGGGGW